MYRNEFPILKEKINGNDLIYFDNSATSQTPQCVINSIVEYYSKYNSNVHRGAHFLSQLATQKYEQARQNIAKHINSKENEVIFTKGTTHSFNIFARAVERNIKPSDEIIISEYEHHSNLVVMQELAKRNNAILRVVPLTSSQEFDYTEFEKLLNNKTKIVSLSLISNVLGEKLDIKRIKQALSHHEGCILCYDGAQILGHTKIDIEELKCDIFISSAHKAYGPTGIGMLMIKEKLIKKLDPVEFGGSMINEVNIKESTYKESFEKFEAGTPDICGAIAFSRAITFIDEIGVKSIEEHEKELITYFFKKAQEVKELKIIGTQNLSKRLGPISFIIEGKNTYDIATLLDMKGTAIREGVHCAQILHSSLDITSTIRVSFAIYNTIDEIDYFFESLELILDML